jgi:hypothetical protein
VVGLVHYPQLEIKNESSSERYRSRDKDRPEGNYFSGALAFLCGVLLIFVAHKMICKGVQWDSYFVLYAFPVFLVACLCLFYGLVNLTFPFLRQHGLASLDGRPKDIAVLSIVVTELEFRDIERHIFGAHLMKCADDAMLENGPEALNRIGVNCGDHVLTCRMVDDAMREFFAELSIAGPLIGTKQADLMRDGFGTKACRVLAFESAETRAITLPLRLTAPTIGVLPEPPVPPPPRLSQCLFFIFATDESFVDRDNAAKLFNVLHQCNADFVAHLPGGFIGTEAHIAHDLERAHALLAGQHEMNNAVPVPERLVGILEDRADQDGEPVAVRGAFVALPMPFAGAEIIHGRVATARANNAFRPAARS